MLRPLMFSLCVCVAHPRGTVVANGNTPVLWREHDNVCVYVCLLSFPLCLDIDDLLHDFLLNCLLRELFEVLIGKGFVGTPSPQM